MSKEQHKDPQYTLRVPKELMDKLKYIAKYNGRSANKEIEQLIIRHVAAWEAANHTITAEDIASLSEEST